MSLPPPTDVFSTDSAMRVYHVLSLFFGPLGAHGPSAAQSVVEGSIPGSGPVRMATPVLDVH